MAAVAREILDSRIHRSGLNGLTEMIRIFHVEAADQTAVYTDPIKAKSHPDIPRPGNVFTTDGETLICQDVSTRWLPGGGVGDAIIDCRYTSVQGTLISLPNSVPRRSWSTQKGVARRWMDLDGKLIGYQYYLNPGFFLNPDGTPNNPTNILNENAQIGADVEYSYLQLDIEMPPPIKLPSYLSQIVDMLDTVNSDPFEGANPGQCYYMGFVAREIGPSDGDYSVTHSFRMGSPKIYDPISGSSLRLGLDEVFFTHMQVKLVGTGEAKIPVVSVWEPGGGAGPLEQIVRRRVYSRADHNQLLGFV